MSSSISGIRLFDYQGNFRVAPPANVNQSFTTAQTDYTSSLTLNGTNQNTNSLLQSNLVIGNDGRLKQADPSSLDTLLNFGNNTLRSQTDATTGSVTRPYRDYVNALNISDKNFNQLMQQDTFTVYNGRVGLRVNTDGSGNVEQVFLQPGSKDLRSGTPVSPVLPDRAEITQRAESRQANDFFLTNPKINADPERPLNRFQKSNPVKPPENSNVLNNRIGQRPVQELPSIQPTPGEPGIQIPGSPTNPLLKRLLQLQPPEIGIQVFGPDAQITAREAEQIGTVKASYGVEYSNSLKDNLALLRERLAQDAVKSLPQQVAQARDGKMPVSPFIPTDNAGNQQMFSPGGANVFQQLSSSVDTTEKKSSGGYIPFRLDSGSQGSGEDREQRRKPRPILNAIA